MSWHKGSSEKDVVFESRDDFGYLAPEQTARVKGVSAVNTKVDSYGLGMTTYYIFGGQHPRPNEGLSENWFELALRATKADYDGHWRSAPNRLARLIKECTQISQVDRMDFALAMKEVDNLLEAILNPAGMGNADLWAEEVLAQLPSAAPYHWDTNRGVGKIQLERGIIITCNPDFRDSRVELKFEFANRGGQQYKSLTQKIESVPLQVKKILEDGFWKWENPAKGQYQLTISASIEVSHLKTDSKLAFKAASETFRIFETIGGVW
jgi:hypothetical protein